MMTLKKGLLLAAFVLGACSSAYAQTLADVMQSMASTVKSINAQANKPAQNASSADLALRLANLCDTAKALTPSTASSASKKAAYEQLLATSAQTARDLAQAFQTGDNAQAVQLLKKLAAEKKEGHTQFK